MKIGELKPNTAVDILVADVVEKGDTREFSKFGKTGRVCTVTVKDETGSAKMSLWNEDVDKVNMGDKIELKEGWAKEYQGEMQVSTGRNGTLNVVGAGEAPEPAAEEAPAEEEKPKEAPAEPEQKKLDPEKPVPVEDIGVEQEDLAIEEETVE